MKIRNPIIRMFNVTKRFGKKNILNKINLEVNSGEFVLVSGPSGAGKTTLMKMLYLGEKVSLGQIIVDGMNLARISKEKTPYLRRKFGVIFQDFKLIPNRTVYENVALVLEARHEKPTFIRKKVMEVLKITGMDTRINSFPLSLSGGEQQRVAVARALVGDPAIILADEPTGSLDNDAANIILDFLLQYHNKGATIFIASHNMELIKNKIKYRNLYLNNGVLEDNKIVNT
ncbi:MAG: cell division ATP-binding protein FtsE [Desulfobacteraceae bacterium 4572_130]|nr:MAG: cell division ATP-binding protein FtsE [Desulfobacteraceae bacterium 4572_130]